MSRRRAARCAVAALMLLAAGCASEGPIYEPAPLPPSPVPPSTRLPTDAEVLALPDAVPKHEPRSRYGNPPFYEVFGKRYHVLATSTGYVERGVASWYGPTFHGERASTQEPYDMYAMTAAHKTLPLPCYARVTNLRNGRSIVVRINDRGPFKNDRIIDLSYAGALKLDMLREGTTLVEVRTLEPGGSSAGIPGTASPPPAAQPAPLFAQAGAFGTRANAERLRDRLLTAGIAGADVLAGQSAGREVYRVRVGPVGSVAQFDMLLAQLRAVGIDDARLAAD